MCQTLCLGLTVQHWGAARLLKKQCIKRPTKSGWQHYDRKAQAVQKRPLNQPKVRDAFQ